MELRRVVSNRGGPLVLGVVLCLAGCGPKPPQTPPAPTAPLAFDPLTQAERKAAEAAALADPRVRELAGAGRVAYVEFLSLKDAEGAAVAGRHAEVVFSRAAADFGVRAIVALGAAPRITEVERISDESVPLTPADIADARQLVLASQETMAAAGPRAEEMRRAVVEGMRVYAAEESDPCYRKRCVEVLFKVGQDYLVTPQIIVNLTTKTVSVVRRTQP